MKIVLGSDHGGLELKQAIKTHLETRNCESITDLGTYTTDSVDYPDFAEKVCTSILNQDADLGILVCGTGIGISIKANRYKGIRAALVHDTFTAQMCKEHNNANVLCLGGRTTDTDTALTLIDTWLDATFEGGRHQNRLDKLDA
ncbi:ribose 5-phosphate isomerase B [bacterium]|nr:ribose 5-phosphate isomerase B [bacterium]